MAPVRAVLLGVAILCIFANFGAHIMHKEGFEANFFPILS